MRNLIVFCFKVKNLFEFFIRAYSKSTYQVNSLNKSKFTINYTEQLTNKMVSRHVQDCFENKAILSNFDSIDAAYIGYLYGIWLQTEYQ